MKHFLLGGLVQVKIHWLENNFTETPTELAELVLKIINPLGYDVKEL
ncbi:TetR family transcriptional regulator C-terminal domain-containing protein [Clostridium sp. PL3]|uniref:TetR family transcriptional regulator C-terminal domain-containing protein n=1 Tax=Clostridium thailandense TaxID=2794346 RepID=A0A949TP48_9CLOT|nr:TetR-like C-terminal domain-containing protein [Clostridium thailandense]MBV7276414.1 TetR family transcriptional regulator C-terminal domain-containing protein [Clostridium thailandense]